MSLGYNTNRPNARSINSINNINIPVGPINSKTKKQVSNVPLQPTNIKQSMSIQDNVITQRRLEYAETQLKKTQNEVKDLVDTIKTLNFANKDKDNCEIPQVDKVLATAMTDITCPKTNNLLFKKNDSVTLLYPMKQENGSVMMRSVKIDSETAELSYDWIIVYEPGSRKFSDFKIS